MSDESYKSIAVDYETWKILTNWAEEECRSISGQIKFLVRTHAPNNALPTLQGLSQPKKEQYETRTPCSEQPLLPLISDPEDSWIQHKCVVHWLRTSDTVRNQLLDIYIEWGGPLTNSELWALASVSLNLSLKAVTKQSSGMFSHGYLKRRKSMSNNNEDKYQFEISSAGKKLVQQRDIKRKELEATKSTQ
tara:strand:+ start:2261 stop:2833 length:573 start_codon:yes stop_codon:yes gene_type:complete